MKRKPILFNKLAGAHRGAGREVIGLIGTHHGVGVTYTGLMLAFYMGEELGRRTAFVECNDHHDMALIENAYEWNGEQANSFSFRRITCYKDVSPLRLSELFAEDYECFILDFGVDFITGREEFLRCQTKIVIGGNSHWDRIKLSRFSDTVKTIHGSASWLCFIPQANSKTVSRIKSKVMCNVWAVPAVREPVQPSGEIIRFFDRFFG